MCDCWHGICCKTATRKVSGTEHWPLLDLYWSDPRHLTWSAETAFGESCPPQFITIVRQFHEGMHGRLQGNGESSLAFPITNGVRQGCVLAPTLFSIMVFAILFDEFSGSDNGIDIQYRTDVSFFYLRRLQAKTKMKTDIVNEFLFADDCELNATTKANMQNNVDKFSIASDNFSLTINTHTHKKTKVMHQPVSGKPYVEPNITIKGQRLKVKSSLTSAAPSLSLSTWITRWTPDSQRQVLTQQECVESKRHLGGNQNQSISSCPYHLPLWLWNVDNFSTAYKEARPLSHHLSEEDSRYDMAKTHPRHRF